MAGGNLYEPQSGRLMSPAGSGENPYVYGGNSPVDRSLGVGRQQMADDFTSSRFDAGYSHYLDPREGWNGNAEDRLFAIGKFAAWGVAIVAGSAASMAAAGVGTVYAAAGYLATQAGWAVGETALEGGIAYATGSKFDAASSFGKNFAVNSATAGLSSAVKWGSKAARYAVRMGAEVAAETTYDVAVNDADFGTSLAINAGASLGFDALGAGIGYGARKFGNSRAGRASVAYAAGFFQSPGSGRASVPFAPVDLTGGVVVGLASIADGIKTRHAAGLSRVRVRATKPAGAIEGVDFGPYKPTVEGHHVHAKAGLRGAGKLPTKYNLNKGFTVSQAYMLSRGWNHEAMTSFQRTAFDALADAVAKGTRKNSMKEHTRIAIGALVAGKVPLAEARWLVAQSLKNLRSQGVYKPSRIPWN